MDLMEADIKEVRHLASGGGSQSIPFGIQDLRFLLKPIGFADRKTLNMQK